MQTNGKSTLAASAIALFFASPALSADIGGGSKDAPVYDGPALNRSGFYVTGTVGYAKGERDGYGSIATDKHGTVVLDEEGNPTELDTVGEDGPLAGLATGEFIFSDLLEGRKSDDFDSTIFGGDVSYLIHLPDRRFGVELGVGATFYADNQMKAAFGGFPVATGKGDGCPACAYPDVGEEQNHGQLGSVSFERDFDIDLTAKGHYFVLENLSLYAGGGLSIAQGSASAEHASNYSVAGQAEGVFDNSFKKNDTSIGYVLLAGAQYWATDRIVVGVEYSYKKHEFDIGDSSTTDAAVFGDAYRYGVTDKLEIDDEIHAVKARVGIKLN
jgi:opacity protein-like surface antigen